MICVSHYQFIHHCNAKWSLYHNTYLIIEICGQRGIDIKIWTTGWRILFKHFKYIIYQALFTVSYYLLKGVLCSKEKNVFHSLFAIINFRAHLSWDLNKYRMDNHPHVIHGESAKKPTSNTEKKVSYKMSVLIEPFFNDGIQAWWHGGLKSCFCFSHEVLLLIEYKLEPTGISE